MNKSNGCLWMLFGPLLALLSGLVAFYKLSALWDMDGERKLSEQERYNESLAGPVFLVIVIGGSVVSFLIFIYSKSRQPEAVRRE